MGFQFDLNQEQILHRYLALIYQSKKLKFENIANLEQQHRGIDVIINHNSEKHNIDEKAQLHYINKDLPTFTFELSYLNKNNELKEGWLFDSSKQTQYYFLVTGIFLKNKKTKLQNIDDIETVKITSVNRKKLINHLATNGLPRTKLEEYDFDIRTSNSFGKNIIPKLDGKKSGLIYYTEHLP
ncbi:hypothetical protein [Tamlana flava]|uniref:hypothetical protein n=1 Tax=Tamlana flava TaxID=3158572 RepID=UPI00351AD025